MNRRTRNNILDSYRPDLVAIEDNLIAAVFPLMKIYPAEFCIRQATQEGAIQADSLLIETSSGTMALGLAIVAKWSGHRLTIVTDSACDSALRRRLEDLGTKIEIVPAPAANGGYQRARIDRLRQIRDENKNCWWVNQYDNPANSGSYGVLAGQLLDMLGRIDCLIGSVGSGGSVCGTSNYLRALFPELHVVGVDTFGSVLFGQPDRPRQLRGLGNSILPRNLEHAMFDEAHWVSAAEAFTATRLLHRKTTLFRGATSGAVWMVAQRWAAEHPNARVVCLFPDDGARYVETIYNDDYLSNNQLLLPHLPQAPRKVLHPLDASDSWSSINWNRRSYQEVMGGEATVGATV